MLDIDVFDAFNWLTLVLTLFSILFFSLTYRKVRWLGFLLLTISSGFYLYNRLTSPGPPTLDGRIAIFFAELVKCISGWYVWRTAGKFFTEPPKTFSQEILEEHMVIAEKNLRDAEKTVKSTKTIAEKAIDELNVAQISLLVAKSLVIDGNKKEEK
jgi:hypothetical protein